MCDDTGHCSTEMQIFKIFKLNLSTELYDRLRCNNIELNSICNLKAYTLLGFNHSIRLIAIHLSLNLNDPKFTYFLIKTRDITLRILQVFKSSNVPTDFLFNCSIEQLFISFFWKKNCWCHSFFFLFPNQKSTPELTFHY